MNNENGLKLNDRDHLTSVLEIEKNMSNNYSIAMNEASNDDLYEEYFDMFTCVKDMARDIYNIMNSYGWYKLEYEDEEKVNKKINELNKKLDNLEE